MRRISQFAALIGFFTFVSPSAASVRTATAAPAAADEVELEFENYTLDNGLQVILHRDPRAPTVAVNLWYHVGSGDEMPGKSGFAHLFEHMMFQGAKHIGEDVHFDLLREIGATGINGTTNSDRTNYYEIVPRHELETALWLESDRMGYLLDLLSEESFANQRDVVRNERRQNYDDRAYGRSRFAVAAALYPEGHPYRYLTIGRHEDLEAASLSDVQNFFLKWYVPSNATITIAGDFDPEQAKALVAKWFGTFPALPKPEHRDLPAPKLEDDVVVEVPDPFARLERMQFVWHTPAYYAPGDLELDVVGRALGANGWGRLYKRLVLEEKVATAVGAWQASKQRSSAFTVSVTLKPGVADARERVRKLVLEEMNKMSKSGPSADELRRFVIRSKSDFIFGLESLHRRADMLQRFNHYTGDPGYFRTHLAQLDELSTGGVQKVAAKWLTAPHAEIITVPAPPEAKPASSEGEGKTTDAKATKGGAK
jgi:predicted Zn-dependent peptidase